MSNLVRKEDDEYRHSDEGRAAAKAYVDLRNQLLLVSRSSWVRRYHNKPVLSEDTVGRHSYVVAWLLWFLTEGKPSAALLMAALAHDTPEAVASDVSAPVKRLMEGVMDALEEQIMTRVGFPIFGGELSPKEQDLLTLADKLEGYLHTGFEVYSLGNRNLAATHRLYRRYLEKLGALAHPTAGPLTRAIGDLYLTDEHLEEDCL